MSGPTTRRNLHSPDNSIKVKGIHLRRISHEAHQRLKRIVKRLQGYTAAAGVGALALGQTAEGAIIFTDVPDQTITQGDSPIYLNLDNVGYNEFAIAAFGNSVRVNPYNIAPQDSQVLTAGSYYVFSFALNDAIGPGAAVAGGGRFAGRLAGTAFYNFVGSGGYVGLQWDIGGGDVRYGWARVDVTADNNGTATLFSYAYEETPNTAIAAGAVPEPSALGLLAAGGGAIALANRRRRRRG